MLLNWENCIVQHADILRREHGPCLRYLLAFFKEDIGDEYRAKMHQNQGKYTLRIAKVLPAVRALALLIMQAPR
jgi:hypothetical protein